MSVVPGLWGRNKSNFPTDMIYKSVIQVPMSTFFASIQSLGGEAWFVLFLPFLICHVCNKQPSEGPLFMLNTQFCLPISLGLKAKSTNFIQASKPKLPGYLNLQYNLKEDETCTVAQTFTFQFPVHFCYLEILLPFSELCLALKKYTHTHIHAYSVFQFVCIILVFDFY